MTIHYMVTLIPSKKRAKKYIQIAQELFSSNSVGYLLTGNSLSHVTICQFGCKQEQDALDIWREISELKVNVFSIRFIGINFVKGLGIHEKFFRAELLVARDKEIVEFHHKSVSIIKSHGFNCLNDLEDLYRPHLTLARIKFPIVISKMPKIFQCPENFTLNFSPCLPSL